MSDDACAHDWNETSALNLVVSTPHDFIAAIIPTPPRTVPVDYCRLCGSIRLRPADLADLREAEANATH